MIFPPRFTRRKSPSSGSTAFMVAAPPTGFRSALVMSLSKLNVEKSQGAGAGISLMNRPKYAFPKNAWTEAPGAAGPVIQTPQEPAAAAALVNQPGKIGVPVRGLCAPATIF